MRKMDVIVLALLLLVVSISNAAVWNLRDVKWPSQTDSVVLEQYRDNTLVGRTKHADTARQWDTVLNAVSGYDNKAVFKLYWKSSGGAMSSWVFQRNLKTPFSGSYTLKFPVYVAEMADSIRLKVFSDTTLVGTAVKTSTNNMDTSLAAVAGQMRYYDFLVYWHGGGSSLWQWTVDWTDTSNTGGVATPTDPDRSYVVGYIYNNVGEVVIGANITAVRTSGTNAAGTTSGVNVVISGMPVSTTTDETGYFSLPLIGTSQFSDTTRGFWDITATYGGEEIFSLKSVWLPSSGVVNIADTLAYRR